MRAHPPPSDATREWLRKVINADVSTIVPLAGGIAQSVTGVTTSDGREYVLRLWSRPDWRETDPDHSPENEVAALAALAGSGLPVPEVVAVDAHGRHGEFPALLMTRLPGTILSSATHASPEAEPLTAGMLRQLVEAAEVLHTLPVPAVGPYAPYADLTDWEPPSDHPAWDRAFAVAAARPAPTPDVFIHRDYHPGNTLWQDGRLTGIIDWTTAAHGPAGVDLAHLRINLVHAYGQWAADTVLRFAPEHNPYWDIRAVLDMVDAEDESLPAIERYLETLL
ncbi:aminoglycoside phosphotransferase family protein [Longispora fulva]|uniref:Aminoglycoside phosphotransferase (APT) family kinase protein n=1 Tax=Longispora fulva TaxID=619741 RepID=A0A8J7GEG6_9ACTN|nr:aminoglycoside phosphotransferase family protein [Longispora fulva]MBG6139128.1 aminoglycoside phosphotransferase (APT) family kinase protein [Longispora fulva]